MTLPNDGEVHRVIVRDMLGRLIKNVEPDPSHTKVNLGSLAKGSYLIFLVRRDNSNYQPYQLLVEKPGFLQLCTPSQTKGLRCGLLCKSP